MSSRHKRNHITNVNVGHTHHHHDHDAYHRRHRTLSFRNSEESEKLWQSAGRSLSPRHRRDVELQLIEENTPDDTQLRLKRDTPGCVVNYNSNRRLKIGCTRHDAIDVSPSCSDEGDEGKI